MADVRRYMRICLRCERKSGGQSEWDVDRAVNAGRRWEAETVERERWWRPR